MRLCKNNWLILIGIGLIGIVGVLTLLWQRSAPKDDASKTVRHFILINEAKVRELGIVLLEISHPDGVTVVPAEAILQEQTGSFVVVEDFDRKHSFLLVSVVVVPDGGGRFRITSGVFHGDKIVVKGAARLRVEPDVISKMPETNCS
jgi:hypothetical protein